MTESAQSPLPAALRCPACRGKAYLCDRPHHGTATWAFHCRSFPYHNRFGKEGDGGPPTEWAEFAGARYAD